MGLASIAASTAGNTTQSLTTDARGQSFVVGSSRTSGLLFRISVNIDGTGDLTLRWGTSSNLGTYRAETTAAAAASGWIDFNFTTSDGDMLLTAGDTYYFGVIETSGAAAMKTGGSYSGGKAYVAAASAGWNMSSDSADHNFVVYIHDDTAPHGTRRLRQSLRL